MADTSPTESKRAQKCELHEMFLIINMEDFMDILSAPNVTKSNTESRLIQIKLSTKTDQICPLENTTHSNMFLRLLVISESNLVTTVKCFERINKYRLKLNILVDKI